MITQPSAPTRLSARQAFYHLRPHAFLLTDDFNKGLHVTDYREWALQSKYVPTLSPQEARTGAIPLASSVLPYSVITYHPGFDRPESGRLPSRLLQCQCCRRH